MPWDVEFPIQTYIDKPAVHNVPDLVEPVVPAKQHQPVALPEPALAVTTQSGRHIRQPLLFEAAHANFVFLHTLSPDKSDESVALLQNDKYSAKPHPFSFSIESAISMAVSSDPDTMTLIEALQQPDRHKFIKTMEKELRNHINRKQCKVVPL